MLDLNKLIDEYYDTAKEIKASLLEAKDCHDVSKRDSIIESVNESLNYRDEILNYLKENSKENVSLIYKDDLFKTENEIEKLLKELKASIENELTSLTQKRHAASKYNSINR